MSNRSRPRVSVIIPAYNTAQYIGETLASVRAQTFTDYEVIVVNDGSPDTEALEQALSPYRAALTYLRQPNAGPSSARNLAIRAARGTYLALLDSDDVWEPDYLAVQVAALEADADIALRYANALIFGDTPDAGKKYMDVFPSAREVSFEALIEQRCSVTSSVTLRREAAVRAGLFDETLRTAEDFDLWLRIIHAGGRIAYDRRPLWRYRKRDGSLTTDPAVNWGNYLRVLEKVGRTLSLSPAERAAVERRRAYVGAMLQLYQGKRHFFAGDYAAAIGALTAANAQLKSRKVALAVLLLRRAPQLLGQIYQARDRFVYRMSTRF